ncbi:MAG: segregation/condensation protein A [Eubacterium sp.]|nr:segregation/condensation protein A [Eubacterium sp.]
MELAVKLEAFEGPLDLLLHLIEKNKVNIYDIPIVDITRQYLEYVEKMPKEDLDSASEFLVMAATLINIKAKMLLPPEVDEEGEEIDPREELVEQLLQYKMYKYMSVVLRERQVDAGHVMYKEPSIPEEVASYTKPIDLDKMCEGIQLGDLHKLFKDIMKRKAGRVDTVHAGFGKIEKEEITLPDKMSFLEDYARKNKTFTFSGIIETARSKMEIIVTFMAVLEMIKTGDITVSQNGLYDDIIITSKIAA